MPLAYLEYDPWWRRNERPCACLLLRYTIQLTCENPDGSTRFEIDYRRDTRSDYPSLFIQKPNRTRSSYELLHSAYLYSTCKLFTRRTTVRLSFVWVLFEFRSRVSEFLYRYMSLSFEVWCLYEEVMNNELYLFRIWMLKLFKHVCKKCVGICLFVTGSSFRIRTRIEGRERERDYADAALATAVNVA